MIPAEHIEEMIKNKSILDINYHRKQHSSIYQSTTDFISFIEKNENLKNKNIVFFDGKYNLCGNSINFILNNEIFNIQRQFKTRSRFKHIFCVQDGTIGI